MLLPNISPRHSRRVITTLISTFYRFCLLWKKICTPWLRTLWHWTWHAKILSLDYTWKMISLSWLLALYRTNSCLTLTTSSQRTSNLVNSIPNSNFIYLHCRSWWISASETCNPIADLNIQSTLNLSSHWWKKLCIRIITKEKEARRFLNKVMQFRIEHQPLPL